MILTEEEAKTKWCPEVRTGLTAGMAVNRHVADAPNAADGVYDETRCRGSACMAWRWTEAQIESKPLADFADPKPKVMADWTLLKLEAAYNRAINEGWPGSLGSTWYHGFPLHVTRHVQNRGYCGKAGTP